MMQQFNNTHSTSAERYHVLIISVHLQTTVSQKVRKAIVFNIDGSKCYPGLCTASRITVVIAFLALFLL